MQKPLAFIGTRTGADGLIMAAIRNGIPVAGWFDRYYHGNTESFLGYPILGSDLEISDQDRERYVFFLASHYSGHSLIENPEHNGAVLRRQRIELIEQQELPVINLIHPTAYVDPSAELGKGVYLGHLSMVMARARVGDYCYLDHYAGIGHDVDLQGNNVLLPHCIVAGGVTFEPGAMAGINSAITPGTPERLVVGRNAKIAAGAVVYRSVAPNQFVSVEGKRMRKLDADF